MCRPTRHPNLSQRAVLASAVAASVALGVVHGGAWPVRLAVGTCGVAVATAADHDVHTARLPNRLVAVAGAAALVVALLEGWAACAGAIAGAALVIIVVALARVVVSGGVGGGDAKLAVAVGLVCGADSVMSAAVAMAVVAASALLSGMTMRRVSVPLGPSLWLGWFVAETAETLTAPAFRPPSVGIYTWCCVASAELLQRASRTLGGGLWE